MKKSALILPVIILALSFNQISNADILAGWTFETSQPTTFGPFSPETGSGQASVNTGGTISSPSGNGSANSFSSVAWNVGDYFQFSTSTMGFDNITISFDQTSSAGGPVKYNLNYSTDGSTFTTFATDYLVRTNGAAVNNVGSGITTSAAWSSTVARTGYSYAFDLSAVTSLNNDPVIYFQLVDDSSLNATGTAITSTGSDRVDNFIINGIAVVPEPSAIAFATVGGIICFMAVRRKK